MRRCATVTVPRRLLFTPNSAPPGLIQIFSPGVAAFFAGADETHDPARLRQAPAV